MKSQSLRFALICSLLLSFASCTKKPTEATPLETNIAGRVLDKDNNSTIPGAQITTSPTTSSVTTDASGSYTIQNVNAGQYVVSAAKAGYNSASINLTVVEGKTASGDIQMEIIKPQLGTSVSNIDFGTTQGTTTFTTSNATGIGSLTWSITTSANWISVTPTSGTLTTGSSTITVTVNRTGLAYGNYFTNISFSTNYGNKDIPITMTVANPNAPQLTVSPLALDFGTNTSSLSFTVRNTGTGRLDWSASSSQSWLAISPISDSTRTEVDQITAIVTRSGLPAATYTATITVTSNGGSQSINVTMTVPAVPALSVSPTLLDFDSTKSLLSFTVSNAGSGSLTWNAIGNQTWMVVAPQSGTNTGTVNVTISRSGLSYGTYSGTVALTSNGGNASVGVNMSVVSPPPPLPVTLTAGTARASSVQLSWTQFSRSDFSAYKVYYSTSPTVSENSTLVTTILTNTTTTYTVSGLALGTTYYFRVYVLVQSQETAGSNTVAATTSSTLPSWQQVALPANFQVQSEHFISESNIWVAGYTTISNYNFPRIYQFNGSQWIQSNVQAQDSVGTLRGIAFRNNTDGWAAGATRIYRYDGTSWTIYQYLSSSYNITDAVGTTGDVWLYGAKNNHPLIMQWNGSAITELIPITSSSKIYDMHFPSATTGFAVDDQGNAFMFNGVGWTNVNTPVTQGAPYSISGLTRSDIWHSDFYFLYHYNGTAWTRMNDIGGNGINYDITQIRMISATEGWAACRSGNSYAVYYYNGSTWNKVGNLPGQLQEIKDYGNGNLWGIIYNSSGPNQLYRLQ